ncbi:hypothetical protein F5X68DRAFT_211702 [Plectosphaerella plurivora]|uniref:Uncharacterized protein n=1 Tax=Plectosphaerella plurivora TaxID=936078 RepID=A0A9P9A7Y9_9PEZI|nr:hypothetical protein F5X68DRAFT_211702 [Plectosphaerella plurivora]
MEGEVTGINFGYPYSLDKVEGNLWLVNAYNQGRGNLTTVGRMMQGLATSITAAMRNYPHESEYIDMEEGEDRDMMLERVALGSNIGLVYKVDTCIHVRWVWIIYPAILLILQVIFCATILLVRPTSTPGGKRDTAEFSDWKSSPLALVSLSWGEGVYQKLGHVSSVRDLEKAVGKTKVILQRGDSDDPKAPRWQLVDS